MWVSEYLNPRKISNKLMITFKNEIEKYKQSNLINYFA